MNLYTEQIEHEDLLLFINSCFAGTSQREFYSTREQQSEALDFLHSYICINYRPLYAATLALGINHHNQQRIIRQLLACSGEAGSMPEAGLIQSALRQLPPQRVFKLFAALAFDRINKRRVRATIRDYLAWRANLSFDAIKYRRLLRIFLRHSHLPLPAEIRDFLFDKGWKQRKFSDPMLETYRQAHFSAQAIYKLPYSIAEGLAARMGIARSQLLEKAVLTDHERLKLQQSAARAGRSLELNPARVGLTRLLIWILDLPLDERRARLPELEAMVGICRRRFAPAWLGFEKLALVLDNSYSSGGSREKQRHPLAIALGAELLLTPLAREARSFWLEPPEHPLLVTPRGASGLARRLLDALEWGAKEIIIVSDGAENDPAGATHWLLESLAQGPWRPALPRIVHVNPVLEPDSFGPGTLSGHLPVVGIREAENLPALWILALFARRTLGRQALETFLRSAADAYLTV